MEVTRAEWGHHAGVEQQASKEAADRFGNGRQARLFLRKVRARLSSNRHTLAANVGETEGRVDETQRASGVPAEELAELSGRSSAPSGGSDTKVRVRTLHAYPDLL
jgi:hypothetical protein